MDFWGKKIHVSREVAARQVAVINSFSSEKRMKIALDFADMGISRTYEWIRSRHPEFSELEQRLAFVRLIYFETGQISEEHWDHYQKIMEKQIRKEWAKRFKAMMEANEWTYDDVAKWGRFRNGKVVEATISRGLPSFAKLAVVVFEKQKKTMKS